MIYFFGDDMSDLRDEDGEQTFKAMDGDDCCIHIIGEGQTAEKREYAAKIYDHATKAGRERAMMNQVITSPNGERFMTKRSSRELRLSFGTSI